MAETELFPEIFQVRRRLLPLTVRIFRILFNLMFVLLPSFHVVVFLVFQGLTVHVLGHRESRLCFFFALASQQKEVKHKSGDSVECNRLFGRPVFPFGRLSS